jgi:hypothetical protein
VLTPFQERIAAIVAGLDEAEDFALAGGGALIIRATLIDVPEISTSSVSRLRVSTDLLPPSNGR